MSIFNLLVPSDFYVQYFVIGIILTVVIVILSILSIVFVMMQPSNSDGINAITGSSETFFGKNKGKSIESRLKRWTVICLIAIIVLAVVFYLLSAIFGAA